MINEMFEYPRISNNVYFKATNKIEIEDLKENQYILIKLRSTLTYGMRSHEDYAKFVKETPKYIYIIPYCSPNDFANNREGYIEKEQIELNDKRFNERKYRVSKDRILALNNSEIREKRVISKTYSNNKDIAEEKKKSFVNLYNEDPISIKKLLDEYKGEPFKNLNIK
ncbi:hypothetical protein ACODGV_12265 [Vagococcus fluvialis]|uniref:hypothetical protein n=1 Tax=Vagococcus fluvialis TaxID=2738 RepID=UPI003B22536D